MKLIKMIISFLFVSQLVACGFYTVPPASKGKILTTSGYQPEVLEPGKYTLWWRDELVTLDTSTKVYNESVNIVLSDKLTIVVDVRFSGRISGSQSVINTMFNDVVAGDDKVINFDDVYKIYGKMIVRNKSREVVSSYNVDEVHKNYKRISSQIAKSIYEDLEGLPIEVSNIAIGSIQYPAVVTEAINQAEQRRLAIAKEEAQAAIDLTKKKNERALAEADYQIEITKAKAIRDKNKIIGEGVTPELLKLRALEVQEAMAKNGAAVFMPYEAMQTVGASNRMFNKN